MHKVVKILLFLSFLTFPVSGAIFHSIDTTRPFHCVLSRKYHNRILIESGRIKKIIHPEEQVMIKMESISGQAFIYVASPHVTSTVLSVITEDGAVQDLEISFEDKPSEVVILRDKISPKTDTDAISECFPPYSINSIIDQVLKGRSPIGYVSVPSCKIVKEIKPGIYVELLDKLIGSFNSLFLFEIRNITKKSKCIQENELSFESSEWVFLEKNTIGPKEKIMAVVSVGHHE